MHQPVKTYKQLSNMKRQIQLNNKDQSIFPLLHQFTYWPV